ncbi:hypothetical protein F2Q65_08195 [Thiohalocapsa marina]|uniref:Uncharacterized protein n=1 Tax=Thiohalocapsa marina TaxID=424902 RepID=A0A5M8FRR1_9GAMM|nr:hypothetical protein [Thiohalocapsa marina]KAA6185665.1 hypothetical protein F2Q65_08195 [Thiohalocapsa marina]
MVETAADCRRGPVIRAFLIAVGLIVGGVLVSGFMPTARLAEAHPGAGLVFAGIAMLLTAWVDALRSRCIRHYVNLLLPLLALACLLALAGAGLDDSVGSVPGALSGDGPGHPAAYLRPVYMQYALFALIGLFALLHFSLHMMPTVWRRGLTVGRTGLIGAAAGVALVLYWHFGGMPRSDAASQILVQPVQVVVDLLGVAVGGLIFALAMRHRTVAES